MTKKDKQDIVNIFNDGITELILPVLDDIYSKMATKDDIKALESNMATKEDIQDLQTQLDTIERKVEANQLRSDDHGKVIDKIRESHVFA